MSVAAAAIVGLVVGLVPAAPAGASRAPDCDGPPVAIRLESENPLVGAPDFKVTHALARRVPILTGRDEPGRTPKERKELEAAATKSKLALYQIFLADFRFTRRAVNGPFSGVFPTVVPTGDGTVVALSIVPPKKRGFKAGDGVTVGEQLEYETFTTFATIGLQVITAQGQSRSGTPAGRVEILEVDDDEICVAFDFELTGDGRLVAAAEGVIAVPVVRSAKGTYFF